jgi:sensor histidine kinase YesM
MHDDPLADRKDRMPPKPDSRAVYSAWWLFWALMILIAVQDARNNGSRALWQPVLWESSSALVISALWLLQRRSSARYDSLIARPWRWFLVQACWLPLYWIAFVPLVYGIRHAVVALAGQVYLHAPWPELFLYEQLRLSLFIALFTVMTFGLLSYRKMLEETLRSERAAALLRQAQLQQLAQQMQPHFLFNALNTIASLMHTDLAKADATLVQLAALLRATLQAGRDAEAALDAEVALARAYVEVMAARFGERVRFTWTIGPDLGHLPLPAVSLQPLVENVFKHTVERQDGPVGIAVSAAREEGRLVLRIDDDRGRLAEGVTPGVGLANLRARLRNLYGEGAALQLSQLAPAGVRAEMRIPCAS